VQKQAAARKKKNVFKKKKLGCVWLKQAAARKKKNV
jgi:hypothetical protein